MPEEAFHEPLEQYFTALLQAFGDQMDAFAFAINKSKAAFEEVVLEIGTQRGLTPERMRKEC